MLGRLHDISQLECLSRKLPTVFRQHVADHSIDRTQQWITVVVGLTRDEVFLARTDNNLHISNTMCGRCADTR